MTTSSDQSGTFADGSATLIPVERIESRIFLIRGEKVILDSDLAELYGVTTKALNQAVRRNHERFPADFMFQLSAAETEAVLRSQVVTSDAKSGGNTRKAKDVSRSHVVTSKPMGRGGRRYRPYAFSEQGVAMLSSVLRSSRAVQVNIAIMRTFVRLRQLIASHADLARKLTTLERKYDAQFKAIFDAIRALMSPDVPGGAEREMGFHTGIKSLRPAGKKRAKS